jgi:hypothetical protein
LIDQIIVVSNLHNGIDQYALPTLERLQSYPHPVLRNVPLQVATTREGGWIVSGGDDGYVRVFDCRTGQLMERLEHEKGQNIAFKLPIHLLRHLCSWYSCPSGECTYQALYFIDIELIIVRRTVTSKPAS